MGKTLIRSNTDAVQAVADLWAAMVQVIKEYQPTGRGILYSPPNSNFMDYMGLDKLKELDGKEYLGIDDQVYEQLVDVVENRYNFDTEFVLVTKQIKTVTERLNNLEYVLYLLAITSLLSSEFSRLLSFALQLLVQPYIKFLVNIYSLDADGWKEWNPPQHIKKVEADKQLFIARHYREKLKQQRMSKKK